MRGYSFIVLGNVLLLCAVFSLLSTVFLSDENLLNILAASSTIGLLAIGSAVVIGSGGIDLSVGSLVGLSATAAALVISDASNSFLLPLIAALLTGALCGGLNGLMVGAAKLPSFIVTLGMLSLARGAALILSNGRPMYGLPASILFLGQGELIGIPVPVIVLAAVGIGGHLLVARTSFGRHALAVGDNENAARNAGIFTVRRKVQIYALSGLLAALAGVISMARINAADPNSGVMYELTAITAAVIGGTPLSGGRASVAGAVLGAIFIGVLQNGLTLMNVPAYYQQVAIGLVLILAVAFARRRGVHAA